MKILIKSTDSHEIELQEYDYVKLPPKVRKMNTSRSNTNQIIFSKEIRKAGLRDEPNVFFGYDPRIKKYRYVCYNNLNPFSKTRVIFKKFDNGNIVKLSSDEIEQIDKINLLLLFCFFE